MIEIVSATRYNQRFFWKRSPLGISLRRLSFDTRLNPYITFDNKMGIGEIYNLRINSTSSHDILVFIHDDVWIDDFYLTDHIVQGLEQYDVIGIAGNIRRLLCQPSWNFVNDKLTWDEKQNLSGAVAHGTTPFGEVDYYGNVPTSCELLDGVILAARRTKLKTSNVYFDPVFKFHFYDLDFCRTARQNNLCLGTWPIAITHQSGGNFGSSEWKNMYSTYLHKWKD
jgi:hypothetical protein